ncbi:hypothetical protein ACJIZ3_022773 [Penstemon smallii]|uniref:Uncharacterized protein n=1 Tax=Penstemon smallii TaxID=265156 RepID=A0ABD3TN43_9LAMI
MRMKEKTRVVALIMLLFCSCFPTSLISHSGQILPLEFGNKNRGGSAAAHENKIGHVAVNGAGRPATICGGDTKGGGSNSPYTHGGSNAFPFYAAGVGSGAANKHHTKNHSGVMSNYSFIGNATLIMISMLACLLLCKHI